MQTELDTALYFVTLVLAVVVGEQECHLHMAFAALVHEMLVRPAAGQLVGTISSKHGFCFFL